VFSSAEEGTGELPGAPEPPALDDGDGPKLPPRRTIH